MSNTSPHEGSLTRVIFELEVDEDGWPPVSAERMWALDLGNGRYRVDNVPWFVRNLAVGDEVLARAADAESYPTFPAGADLKAIIARLRSGEVDGSWAWEEGRITRAWESAAGD